VEKLYLVHCGYHGHQVNDLKSFPEYSSDKSKARRFTDAEISAAESGLNMDHPLSLMSILDETESATSMYDN
jgi:hypothetical protein